jgi:uncharacterized protein YutE (UPF0331/DUF86 family)
MDRDVILFKIESLDRCLDRVRSKVPAAAADLSEDLDSQDVIVLNLERAVQICVDLAAHMIAELKVRAPMTMSESFARLAKAGVIDKNLMERMQKAVGFRNIAVHEYETIDWNIVYSIITKNLDDFRDYAAVVLGWMDTQK